MSVPKDFFDDKKFVPDRLAKHIMSNLAGHHLITPRTDEGGDVTWQYHEDLGIYTPDGVGLIKEVADEALGAKAKPAHIKETLFLIQIRTYMDRKKFLEEPGLIVVKNGVLHLDTGELRDHGPEYYAKTAIPVAYDPDATNWEIIKFLEEVIPDAVDTFQEWLGYHLYKDMIYHKAAMFIGDGANGKTTLQDLMNEFLGRDNISHVNLYRLVESRFSTSELYLKLANISPEIATSELKRTGTFKSLTGHDRIMAEKKYKDPFYFTNYAKLTFLCNQLPVTPDQSRAFFRRWLIFVFPNKFEGDLCDSKILRRITTPEELSGLLNWALVGLHRLQKNGRFTKAMTSDELQELYETMSDPITAFIADHLIHSTSGAELKSDVYQAYYRFCRDRGYVAVTARTFTVELKPRITGLGEATRKIRGHRGRCWTGIRLMSTQGAQGTLASPVLIENGNSVERDNNIVLSVPNVISDPEDQLFKDARDILEVNGGTITQTLFFKALVSRGYNQQQASVMLRTDPRLAFRGMDVSLVRGPPR